MTYGSARSGTTCRRRQRPLLVVLVGFARADRRPVLRLQIGLEDVDDLKANLEQALAAARAA